MSPSKSSYIIVLLLYVLLGGVKALKNKAMFLNAGKFFYNFRMQTSLLTLKYIMMDLGFDEKDVQILT